MMMTTAVTESYSVNMLMLFRVATAQGTPWNLVPTFSRQGKHGEFGSDTGKNLLTW